MICRSRFEKSRRSATGWRERIPSTREDLKRIIKSANRMASLIRDLKSYSEITGERPSFELTDVSMLAREAINDLEIAIQEAEARVEVSELPPLEVDKMKMRQVFQNLISNSIKYAKENEKPSVRITGHVNDGMSRIYVEDNGIGFDEKYLDQIFKPFKRLHGNKSLYEGTGIGLAICRKVVEIHGGTITAKKHTREGCNLHNNSAAEAGLGGSGLSSHFQILHVPPAAVLAHQGP